MFLLSGKRRILHVNAAWERLTDIPLAEVRGSTCRRRGTTAADRLDQVLAALTPPPEALDGRPCQIRRRAPGAQLAWWEIDYFPWSDSAGPAAILAKIRVIQDTEPPHAALPEKLLQLQKRVNQAYRLESWPGEAPSTVRLVSQLRLAAQTRVPALIQGPPGSGKTWAARTIHQLGSTDRFFAVFDSRLSVDLLNDLLGNRGGRLGTLYLRRVDRLPRDLQALVVQRLDSEGTPRLLAGASVDLEEAVRAGQMLPELHCRLATLTVQVPALAERRQDWPLLFPRVLARASEAAEHQVSSISSAAQETLNRHFWPGNMRELYEVLLQACRRAKSDQIDAEDLPFYLRGTPAPPEKPIPLDETLAKIERRLIELALRLAQGNKTTAADFLTIWRPRLLRRMEQFGLGSDG